MRESHLPLLTELKKMYRVAYKCSHHFQVWTLSDRPPCPPPTYPSPSPTLFNQKDCFTQITARHFICMSTAIVLVLTVQRLPANGHHAR